MFFIVRGREQTKQMTNPTAVKTIVQVPCSVTVFIMTLKVKMWEAIMKIEKSSWPRPNSSRPKAPNKTSPASAKFWMWGYRLRNWKIVYPV